MLDFLKKFSSTQPTDEEQLAQLSQVPPVATPADPNALLASQPPLPDPMGMAASLPARSGDDMLKPTSGMAESLPARSGVNMGGDPNRSPAVDGAPIVAPQNLSLMQKYAMPGGYGAGLDDKALKAAIEQKSTKELYARLAKAGSMAGDAIARTKTDRSMLDDLEKDAGGDIKDIELRRAGIDQNTKRQQELLELSTLKEKSDPNSKVSMMAQDILKKMGVSNSDGMALSQIEKVFPVIGKYFEHIGAASTKADSKKADWITKESGAMGSDLDPSRMRGGFLGKTQDRLAAAQRLEVLHNQYGDDLPPNVMREFASSLASLISNGASGTAVHQINELVPQTKSGGIAKLEQWLTDSPHGTGQQAFVKQMMDTVKREKELAQDQIGQQQVMKAYTTHKKLHEASPEDFYNNLLNRVPNLTIDDLKAMEKSGKYDYADQKIAKASAAPGTNNSAPPTGKILMTDPNGQPAYILQDKKDEAIKRGFSMPKETK